MNKYENLKKAMFSDKKENKLRNLLSYINNTVISK